MKLAYLADRSDDSSASPSHVVIHVNKQGAVVDSDVVPGGQDPAAGQCALEL